MPIFLSLMMIPLFEKIIGILMIMIIHDSEEKINIFSEKPKNSLFFEWRYAIIDLKKLQVISETADFMIKTRNIRKRCRLTFDGRNVRIMIQVFGGEYDDPFIFADRPIEYGRQRLFGRCRRN